MEAGADVNRPSADGATPLALAASADPDADNQSGAPLLMYAVVHDDAALAARLLEAGSDPNGGLYLHRAAPARPQRVRLARLLIEAEASVNLRDPKGSTPLVLAARAGNAEIVRALLAAGADPNKHPRDGEPLLIALQSSRDAAMPGILEQLIDAGADVQAPGKKARNPMAVAIERNDVALVVRLRAAGARPEAERPLTP